MTRKVYQVLVSRTAEKTLLQIAKTYQKRLISVIESLALNPFPQGCKKLTGEDATFRVRVGEYRIIYEIEGKKLIILVLKVGHRKDIYR